MQQSRKNIIICSIKIDLDSYGLCSLQENHISQMSWFIFDLQKQNAIRVYWLLFIFLFLRSLIKKDSRQTMQLLFQKKSCFYLELIQKYKSKKISSKKKNFSECVINETQLKVGTKAIQIWVTIEIESEEILEMNTSKERNMFIVERFLSVAVQKYEIHFVSIDGGTWYP